MELLHMYSTYITRTVLVTVHCAVYIYVFRQLSYTIPSKTIKTISFRKGLEMIKSIMDGGRYAKSFHLMNLVSLIYTLNETCSHLSNSVKLFPKSKSSGQCLLKLVFL